MPKEGKVDFRDEQPKVLEETVSPGSSSIQLKSTASVKPSTTQEDYKQDLSEIATSSFVDLDEFKSGKVEIYGEDSGPNFYPVKGNIVTAPIITKNLPKAFNYLPIYGQPKQNESLDDFQNNKIREYVGCGFSDEDFGKLARYCSPNHLKTGKELVMLSSTPQFGILPPKPEKEEKGEDGDSLNVVRKFKLRMMKDKANLYLKKLKYRGMRVLPFIDEDSDDKHETNDAPLEPGKDLIFRVRCYRPFLHGKERYNARHSLFSCDVVLLGRSPLSALRERIVCANDVDLRHDVSASPFDTTPSLAKDLFPSGFLFINNVFYVDERAGCKDYSAPIREWAKRRGMGDFPKRGLRDVRLDELVLRLGHPEVYVHQGNCEHLFTFSEVRLLGAGDPARESLYPRHTAALHHQTLYCTTCAEFGAKWVVVGCARVPFDPAFFCDTCLRLYLYVDGRKIGRFRAYAYRGNEINTLKSPG